MMSAESLVSQAFLWWFCCQVHKWKVRLCEVIRSQAGNWNDSFLNWLNQHGRTPRMSGTLDIMSLLSSREGVWEAVWICVCIRGKAEQWGFSWTSQAQRLALGWMCGCNWPKLDSSNLPNLRMLMLSCLFAKCKEFRYRRKEIQHPLEKYLLS